MIFELKYLNFEISNQMFIWLYIYLVRLKYLQIKKQVYTFIEIQQKQICYKCTEGITNL